METDHIFGRVLASLEEAGGAENTLVVFASDNGCAPYIGVREMEAQGHYPSAGFRGYKSDAWDGGHRIPCLVRWPGVISAGSTCDQLACLSDLMATCADLLGATLPANAGEDSVSWLPLFRGPRLQAGVRDHVVHHSISGKFAIRDREWKLVLCPGSGGWSKNDAEAAREGLPLVQLYNLRDDPGEQTNLQSQLPDRVKGMVARLKQLVAEGRSTPGPRQANDAPVDIWKLDTMPGVEPSSLDDY
jgi:arylsulfatase A-like enzyme